MLYVHIIRCKHYSNFSFIVFPKFGNILVTKVSFNLKASSLMIFLHTFLMLKNSHVINSTNTTEYTPGSLVRTANKDIRNFTVNIVQNSRRVVHNSCRYTNEFLIAV